MNELDLKLAQQISRRIDDGRMDDLHGRIEEILEEYSICADIRIGIFNEVLMAGTLAFLRYESPDLETDFHIDELVGFVRQKIVSALIDWPEHLIGYAQNLQESKRNT